MPKDDWVYWLNLTNIGLGVVVFLAVLLVAAALVWELVPGHKNSGKAESLDEKPGTTLPDGRFVPGLGITMADGGERITPLPEQSTEKKRS
jgi:hypothetical protein